MRSLNEGGQSEGSQVESQMTSSVHVYYVRFEIYGFHGGEKSSCCGIPTFRRTLLPPSSGFIIFSSLPQLNMAWKRFRTK